MLILVVFVKQVFSYHLYPDNPPNIAFKLAFDIHFQSFRHPLKSLRDGAECYRGMTTIYT